LRGKGGADAISRTWFLVGQALRLTCLGVADEKMSGISPTYMSEPEPHRGYGALRVGRWSAAGADYFVTGCLERPLTGLTTPAVAESIRPKLHEMEASCHWKLRSYVLMPDHFHLLFTLGTDRELPAVMRLLKGPLTPMLRKHGLRWQKNFYDRCLRSDDEVLPVFLYIFVNPYQAGLAPAKEPWPWYYCAPEDWKWFAPLTNESVPFPEWLK
jgi:putative transposase